MIAALKRDQISRDMDLREDWSESEARLWCEGQSWEEKTVEVLKAVGVNLY